MPPDESLELFADPAGSRADPGAPLADRMRPRTLDEIVGQERLLGPGAALRALVEAGLLPSLILWGPPGCGKTTLARLLAAETGARLESLSAVMAGVKEIRSAVERGRRERAAGRRCVLFLDELHRLNRAQQDALLPHVEAGTVTLIGATTENPSFEVIAPLLSRCRVFSLERLSRDALAQVLRRAAEDPERGLGRSGPALSEPALEALVGVADADARRALGLLETAAAIHRQAAPAGSPLGLEAVREAAGRRLLVHDRDREAHYDVVSALIKSLRASDPDAALYYAARMLAAGEDPRFVARRLVIFASEDVGNAEPMALGVATAAYLAVERIGMPEGRIPLAQAVTYLACAPKSNAAYVGINLALEAAEGRGSLPVPLHLRNAPTGMMKAMGYGADYVYPHDAPDQFVAAGNLPEALGEARFYEPKAIGAEAALAERLAAWRRRRAEETDPER
jgi:putative ATPase